MGKITGKHFSRFYYLVIQKENKCRYMNSLLQYGYISKLLFQANAQYLLKMLRKKNARLKKPWMKF